MRCAGCGAKTINDEKFCTRCINWLEQKKEILKKLKQEEDQ